jgi:hypothetical protein
LRVEPGSKTSVTARLGNCAPLSFERLFGFYDGTIASARISPVRTSTAMTAPALAR